LAAELRPDPPGEFTKLPNPVAGFNGWALQRRGIGREGNKMGRRKGKREGRRGKRKGGEISLKSVHEARMVAGAPLRQKTGLDVQLV